MSSTPGIFNVLDYGAVGDGSVDDTVHIQSAINAAYEAGGGIAYLPKGRYLIDGNMTVLQRPSQPGGNDGTYDGTTSIPNIPGTMTAFPLPGMTTANNGNPSLGQPTVLPNGPLLLFENVTLQGDGPDITFLLAGENIYGGYMLAPSGSIDTDRQSGVLLASVNWWADYASDLDDFLDGFFAHNVFVKDLSIDCQGKLGINAGMPVQVISETTHLSIHNSHIATAADGNPVGQLTGAAIIFQDVQNCGISNVWIYDGAVNGILIQGTKNLDAHANGPIAQSYEQTTGSTQLIADLEAFISNFVPADPFGTPSKTSVPFMNASITDCRVDLNYPKWLAGTRTIGSDGGGHGYTGGSEGNLPIRSVGAAGILISRNRVGQRNQPSNFGEFTPPTLTVNFPDVAPNTSDGMDCPGSWHISITNNLITNCGDGIGSAGNGSMVIANNLIYNFGSNAVDLVAPVNNDPPDFPSTAKSASQTVISGNVFFLSADSGSAQQAINYDDITSAASGLSFGSGNESTPEGAPEQASSQQGDLIIADNVFYASNISTFCALHGWGIIVRGNIFDFAGNTPTNQPTAFLQYSGDASATWPPPSGIGINVNGNDILIEGNIFRNAGPPGMPNSAVIGVQFPPDFPPPMVSGDTVRVLIKGNSFDPTIGTPIQNSSTDASFGLPRILDNIGVNPVGFLATSLVGVPSSGVPFLNPYPYDCFVNVIAVASTTSVSLYGVAFGAIATGQQRAYLVKAGGSITLSYTGMTKPTWIWVGL